MLSRQCAARSNLTMKTVLENYVVYNHHHYGYFIIIIIISNIIIIIIIIIITSIIIISFSISSTTNVKRGAGRITYVCLACSRSTSVRCPAGALLAMSTVAPNLPKIIPTKIA